MPVYNGARFLPSAFASLSKQSLRDFEIVMVDDGSSDGSADIGRSLLERYGLQGQVITTENRGGEQARDACCLAAKASILAPFDCDDAWEPTYLEEMVGSLQSDPSIGLVYCDFDEEFTDTGGVVRKSTTTPWIQREKAIQAGNHLYRFDAGSFFSMLLLGQVLFPPCTMFRRAIYDAAGGYSPVNPLPKPHPWLVHDDDARKNVSLDWCFGLRASRLTAVAYLDKPLLKKTRHSSSYSGNAVWTAKCDVRILRAVLQDDRLSATDRSAARTRLATRALEAGYGDWRYGNNPREARRWLMESLRMRPTVSTFAYVAATLVPGPVLDSMRHMRRASR